MRFRNKFATFFFRIPTKYKDIDAKFECQSIFNLGVLNTKVGSKFSLNLSPNLHPSVNSSN